VKRREFGRGTEPVRVRWRRSLVQSENRRVGDPRRVASSRTSWVVAQ
jgi:hypothetical protein